MTSASRSREPQGATPFVVTVNVAVLTIVDRELRVLLTQRSNPPPFKGAWSLPGGFVRANESLERTAIRELQRGTGIVIETQALQQLGAYAQVGGNQRLPVLTVAYWTVVAHLSKVPLGRGINAAYAEMIPVAEARSGRVRLAFNHRHTLDETVRRLKRRIETTNIAHRFCRPEFTIRELQEVYEAIWEVQLDPGNFQRKVRQRKGFLTPTQRRAASGRRGGRPAKLWKVREGDELDSPLSPERPRRRDADSRSSDQR